MIHSTKSDLSGLTKLQNIGKLVRELEKNLPSDLFYEIQYNYIGGKPYLYKIHAKKKNKSSTTRKKTVESV